MVVYLLGIVIRGENNSVISNLKNKLSFGHDLIFNKLVKLIKSVILKPLTSIISQMLSTRIFTDCIKLFKVIPFLKKNYTKGPSLIYINFQLNYLKKL